ncbi:amino acid permease [Paraburkholderia domus]|uniref:amino acid permease n=1 Tax=Paraburkholderia domus TaxID=2793075 RepID=UPI001912F580|nr:amino acid permease [Paraburkholderia domus]MBK5065500.1 amino acid permease [Burkholderia sp. R-70199]CAE6808608.1 putative amino acid permease YhdG [Paraburkholderia domus]CAE6957155.1 putative amino acid permease YhdG [Paraburkholderia domus]
MADTSYMARKSVADIVASAEGGERQLSKSLGAISITAMGIGAIIGAGIFVLTGTAAANFAGPSIILSFVLGGIACAFVGLCYSELAAMLPVCGSSYTYTYATLGELFAWIIGWDLILEYAMGAATVAVGWSGYIVSLLHNVGINIPPTMAAAPGTTVKLADGSMVAGVVNLPAVFIIAVLTTLLVLGTKESARLNNIMVAIKLTVVVAFIAIGAFFVHPTNWHPFIPQNTGEFGNFGVSGILRGSAVVFFAFIGFDAVSTAAQEARKPQIDMPIGILGSLVICTVLYIAVAGVLTGLVPYAELNVPDPIAKGVDVIGVTWFSVLIKIGALTGLTTVILVLLYGQSRIFFTMSQDGLLPHLFARVHPRLQTPHLSQMMIGTIVAIVAAFTPINVLGEMVSIGTLFAFILVCGAVIYLRRSDADAARPFRAPGVPVIPILGILFCLLLMAGLPLITWLRLFVWLVIGLVIYGIYGRNHSRLRHPERAPD